MPPTLEPPTKATASEAAGQLPDLTHAFSEALKTEKAKEAPAAEAPKEPVKEPAKGPEAAKEAAKEPIKETPKEAPVKGKKSALDAALSDDATVEKIEPDEVTKLIESKDPNWDKARETMKRQSEELKSFRERKPELPPEIATELASVKELKAEREKLQKENAQMRDSIMALDVRFDPAVQEKIQGRDTQVSRLAASLKEAGADADAFVEAMALPLAKRGKMIDSILDSIESGRTRTVIERKLADIEVLDEQLDEQLSKPHESFEQLKQKREIAAREHAEQVERFKSATYEKVQRDLPKLSKLMRQAPEDSEGAAEYNASLKADLEKAPSLLSVSPEEATLLTFKAARYDSAEKMVLESRAKIQALETELAKYEGAEPGFRGGGKPKPTADHERPIQEVFQEALAAGKGEGL